MTARKKDAGSTGADRGTVAGLFRSQADAERAIRDLPDGCRAAFLLHDVEGFEHREIASLLGIAEGTSKSQVHKARRRLRSALAQKDRVEAGP